MTRWVAAFAVLWAAHVAAQTPATQGRGVQGTVFDSLARAPLAGAMVSLVSADAPAKPSRSAVSDAAGRFEFAGVSAGVYLVGFLHPLLDSLGIEPPTRRLVVPPLEQGPPVRADLAIPDGRTLRDVICQKPTTRVDSTGVLIGHLQDAETNDPIGGGKVTAQWSVISFANGRLTRSLPTVSVTPSQGGWFAFCGLPWSAQVAIQATHGADSTGTVLIQVAPFGVTRRDLYIGAAETVTLAPTDSAQVPDSMRLPAERVHRGAGRLSGIVRDAASGKPLPGVQVSVEGTGLTTVADEDGTFTLGGLPLGTQLLVSRKVGYVPDERPVNLIASGTARAQPSLVTIRKMLDTVRVRATRLYDADRNGFLRRQKVGMGRYIGEEDVEKLHPFQTTDLLWRVPAIRVDQGRFDKEVSMRGAFGGRCRPGIYIDGVPYRYFSASDLDNMVPPDAIAGIEVYDSPAKTPAEFSDPFSNCGSIVVWTRVPDRSSRP